MPSVFDNFAWSKALKFAAATALRYELSVVVKSISATRDDASICRAARNITA